MNYNIVIEVFDVKIVHIAQCLERTVHRLDHHVLAIVLNVPIVISEILGRSFGT